MFAKKKQKIAFVFAEKGNQKMSKRFIDADDFRKNAYYADTDIDIGVYISEYGYADVEEVKHGEWIVHPHCYECSICEFEYELDVSAFEYLPTDCCLYFCPCCGAKMDGERKEQ